MAKRRKGKNKAPGSKIRFGASAPAIPEPVLQSIRQDMATVVGDIVVGMFLARAAGAKPAKTPVVLHKIEGGGQSSNKPAATLQVVSRGEGA